MESINDKERAETVAATVRELQRQIASCRQTEELVIAQRDLGIALSGMISIDEALQLCLQTALGISGTSFGGIYLVDDSGDLRLATWSGLSERDAASVSCYGPDTPNWQLVMRGQPCHACWDDLKLPPRDWQKGKRPVAVSIIPVLHHGRVIACFNVACVELGEMPPATRTALESIASQVGSAIARLQAEERLCAAKTAMERRMAQLRVMASELTRVEQRERRRLAQLLHDSLQQLLLAARMKVARLRRLGYTDDAFAQIADQVDELIEECIKESRSLTMELSPRVLYEEGLAKALEWLATRMEEEYRLAVHVAADRADDPSDEDLRVFLFQAVRELLFNVVKHAQAQHATVVMKRPLAGRLQIEVKDDGVGCDPGQFAGPTIGGGGFGLFSIRERLELLGGRMEADTSPGRGMCLEIIVPVPITLRDGSGPTAANRLGDSN